MRKVAASVTVNRIPDMTKTGREAIGTWLRRLADDIEREPETFAVRFRARYLYDEGMTRTKRGVAK